MPDGPRRRSAPPALVAGGALLGAAVGALGTAAHLSVAPLSGRWTLPWGVVLALVLAGSAQRWWMDRAEARGVRPIVPGAAVVLAAFTTAVALTRLPGDDRLGLPWTPGAFAALPGPALASVAWVAGLPLAGAALLVLGARRPRTARGGRSDVRGSEYPGGKPVTAVRTSETEGRP